MYRVPQQSRIQGLYHGRRLSGRDSGRLLVCESHLLRVTTLGRIGSCAVPRYCRPSCQCQGSGYRAHCRPCGFYSLSPVRLPVSERRGLQLKSGLVRRRSTLMVGMPSGPVAGAAEPGPLPGTSERPGPGSAPSKYCHCDWRDSEPPDIKRWFRKLEGASCGPRGSAHC